MVGAKPLHSAPEAAAGYLYQARLALAECLRYAYADSGVEVAIEKLDDVSFEKDGSPLELLQAKHHLKHKGDLTDGSIDIWKTLRAWAEAIKSDPSLPGRTRLVLITTAQAPEGSAASFLRPKGSSTRNVSIAEGKLVAAAGASQNVALAKAVASFTALAPAMRAALLGAIEVLDGMPLIADLEAVIEDRLRMMAPRGKTAAAREALEGWWWPRLCQALQATEPTTIPIVEVEQKLDDIRDSLKRDALPLDMENADPRSDELDQLDEMRFVRQLHGTGIGSGRILFAKRDFYRASAQRSQWARRSLLFDGEVSRFERTLIEEWQPRFEQKCDGLEDNCNEAAVRQAAQELYAWVENEARFPIRTTISRFLNVGSYHILADALRLGWHRDYLTFYADDGDDGSNDS